MLSINYHLSDTNYFVRNASLLFGSNFYFLIFNLIFAICIFQYRLATIHFAYFAGYGIEHPIDEARTFSSGKFLGQPDCFRYHILVRQRAQALFMRAKS